MFVSPLVHLPPVCSELLVDSRQVVLSSWPGSPFMWRNRQVCVNNQSPMRTPFTCSIQRNGTYDVPRPHHWRLPLSPRLFSGADLVAVYLPHNSPDEQSDRVMRLLPRVPRSALVPFPQPVPSSKGRGPKGRCEITLLNAGTFYSHIFFS